MRLLSIALLLCGRYNGRYRGVDAPTVTHGTIQVYQTNGVTGVSTNPQASEFAPEAVHPNTKGDKVCCADTSCSHRRAIPCHIPGKSGGAGGA